MKKGCRGAVEFGLELGKQLEEAGLKYEGFDAQRLNLLKHNHTYLLAGCDCIASLSDCGIAFSPKEGLSSKYHVWIAIPWWFALGGAMNAESALSRKKSIINSILAADA